jgi:uncharacterized protein YecE (DUF72 family)
MTAENQSKIVQVGCQGWNYDDWTGDEIFYPRGAKTADMLEIYARAFETVEVDSTFYAIPAASTVEKWRKRTPAHFTFALKLPQSITHERMLRPNSYALLAEFCEAARVLREKLAAVLIQLPPNFALTAENGQVLKEFLPQLPPDIRFAVEFRANEWLHPKVLSFLREHNVALALVAGKWLEERRVWELACEPTADFAYLRWMGERDLTSFARVQRPQGDNLQGWAELIKKMQEPCIYAYFSNFYEGHAPQSANTLKQMLGQPTVSAADLQTQPSLF